MAATVSEGMPEGSSLVFLTESKALKKCRRSKAACRFFALTPSKIRRTITICARVDLLFTKFVLVSPEHLLYFGLYSVEKH